MSSVTIPKAALVLVLQQVILSNCRAKDCRENFLSVSNNSTKVS